MSKSRCSRGRRISASIKRTRWLISERAIDRLVDTVVFPSLGLALEITSTRGLCSENMMEVRTVRKDSAMSEPCRCQVTNSTGFLVLPLPIGMTAAVPCPRPCRSDGMTPNSETPR